MQALLHASVAQRKKLFVDWIAACDLEDATAKEVTNFQITHHLRFCLSQCFVS